MRPEPSTTGREGPARLSTMARPRGGGWLDDEITGLAASGVSVLAPQDPSLARLAHQRTPDCHPCEPVLATRVRLGPRRLHYCLMLARTAGPHDQARRHALARAARRARRARQHQPGHLATDLLAGAVRHGLAGPGARTPARAAGQVRRVRGLLP